MIQTDRFEIPKSKNGIRFVDSEMNESKIKFNDAHEADILASIRPC